MDPQLLIPSPAADFLFDSSHTSPYTSAPSSPKMFVYTAPTNPISLTNSDPLAGYENIHQQENEYSNEDDTDFAFDFSGQLDKTLISAADELFDSGKIKPLEPPPRSYKNKNFSETFHQTPREQTQNTSSRQRERSITTTRHKVSRSLSPSRVSDEFSDNQKVPTNQSFPFGFTWYNKWNLKDLLLFRSTSEGSATTSNCNESLKKYAMITKGDGDVKNSSFRSSDGGCSVVGGSARRRMKRKMSAHEIHYTENRAAAVERRRKTFLPYKSGLLGCLGFGHSRQEVSSRGR